MPKFDVVCVGNAKIDAFLSIHEASKHLRLAKDSNELCIKSGEKIAVDKCEFLLGGNAANVAVGLSRLGLKSSLYAEIGNDELSHKIINTLKKEDVHTENVKRSENNECSISVIINFKNERTIFSEHIQRLHDFTFDNLSTKWVYLTSIGEEWKNAYESVVEFVKKTKCRLAFNPGTLQINAGYQSIANVLSITDTLFVNGEEAERIVSKRGVTRLEGLPTPRTRSARSQVPYGTWRSETSGAVAGGKGVAGPRATNIEEFLCGLQKLGPEIVVITDGENGSHAIDEKGKILSHGIIKTKIVERTGAGDAYSTGFLAAILHGLTIKDAMSWGAINAASVIEQIGAQAGLLTKESMRERLK